MLRSFTVLVAGLISLSGINVPHAQQLGDFNLGGSPAASTTRTAAVVHTRATLHLEVQTAQPGETVWAAVRLHMDPEWHTYWKNAGEGGLGIPTRIIWQLPPGVTAGEIAWPVPEKLPAADSTTYVFHDEAALLIPLTLARNLKPGTLELTGEVRWMECKVACIPQRTNVTAQLVIGGKTELSADAPRFVEWRQRLPKPATGLQPRASWESRASGDKRPLIIEWIFAEKADAADFFPGPAEDFDVSGATEVLDAGPGKIRLRKTVLKFEGDWPRTIAGLLVMKSGEATSAHEAVIPIGGGTRGDDPASPANVNPQSLGRMLLFAFLGGLILNIMPCVLPVIALKILGFVSHAREAPGRVRLLGLAYAAGVLASFLVLAALVVGLKAAGHQAGWGMQFSSPIFIVGVSVLVTLVALNLLGVFEVTLSGNVMGKAGAWASQPGAGGAFLHGVLATILATPCTAPFLGVALGFAFVQPPTIIVLMFLTVGLGLAAPYVVLSWQPAWLKFLPKPGSWMETFKKAMAFPMLAVAVWLASLGTSYYGDRAWWLGVFLVFVGAAAWVFGEFVQRGSRRRGVAGGVALLLLIGGCFGPLEGGLDWRSGTLATGANEPLGQAPKGYAWQPWSPEAVTQARAEGRTVVVDFTAKWCWTCNVSVKPAFESKTVIAKLESLKAVALLADYTLYPPEITEELAKFDRAAVPLVLVYPPDAAQPPAVLPEPLPFPAPYTPTILRALEGIPN